MITCTKDTSSECGLLCFFLFSVTGSADVHFVCLLYFIYLLEGEGEGGGSMCMLYFVAAVALSVCVRGAGANLNTVKENSYFTLESNQSYIYVNIHLKKMNLKILCTSYSD